MQTNHETRPFEVIDAATRQPLDLVMQELWLEGRILPVGADLRVQHLFRCGGSRPVEAIYTFALPRDAALRRFQVRGAGFSVRSELRPTAEAEELYEKAMENGSLATLARQYRDGLIQLAVGNLKPGEAVWVELELLAGVELRDEGWQFRFPFTLAPTYHKHARVVESSPGVGEIELPDEFGDVILPRWLREARDLHRVGFDLEFQLPGPVQEIRSPSHRIVVQTDPLQASRAKVCLATDADVPDRDLVLEMNLARPVEGIFGGASAGGTNGFAVIVPSSVFGKVVPRSRRVVFVLDRSGSMEGLPIAKARRAIEACLGACFETDRFGIVAFGSSVDTWREHLEVADAEGRRRAREWLGSIDADGGTDLLGGLHAGLAMLGEEGGDVLLVTDGQVAGTEDILSRLPSEGPRIHLLGIGSASQDRFLSLLARSTGGQCRFLTPRERVDLAALELFANIGSALAREIRVEVRDADPGAGVRLTTAPPRAVFRGTPLVVFGETGGPTRAHLILEWSSCDPTRGRCEIPLDLRPDPEATTVRQLGGARLITEAEAQLGEVEPSKGSPKDQSRTWKRLASLSETYGLASRAMALVAVVKRKQDHPGELPHTAVVPVGMPEDTSFSSYFGPAAARAQRPGTSLGRIRVHYLCLEPLDPSTPSAAELEFLLNRLMELAAELEPDGGIPGPDEEQRWLASALVALCLQWLERERGFTFFHWHIQRLLSFLRGSPLTSRDPRAQAWLSRAERKELTMERLYDWLRRIAAGQRIDPEEFWACVKSWRGDDQQTSPQA